MGSFPVRCRDIVRREPLTTYLTGLADVRPSHSTGGTEYRLFKLGTDAESVVRDPDQDRFLDDARSI